MPMYPLSELCDAAGVTPRTVRYYIAQGLIGPPSGAGPAARYDERHLRRLRLIRKLQREHLPLAEIRRRLDALPESEVARLSEAPARGLDSAADYVARVLRESAPLGSSVAARPAQAAHMPEAGEPSMRMRFEAALGLPRMPGPRRGPWAGESARPLPMPLAQPSAPAPSSPRPADISPLTGRHSPTRSQWDRVSLTPDIEIHVRRPLSRDDNRRVERLLDAAHAIFEEELP
jgi:DNA-binding transcriptional MerR regulator